MSSTNNLNLDSSYTHDNIISIMNDIIGLYLVIKNTNNDSNNSNSNRAKLTIKTILMSLCKQDIDNTFYKYYDLFKNILFKIKDDKVILNPEEINNREVAFALLTQIKLIIDSYWKNSNNDNITNNNTLKDIIEKGFSTLDNQNFYLFKDMNNNEFITNINQIKDNIKEFKLFCQNMIIDCSKELLEKYFGR